MPAPLLHALPYLLAVLAALLLVGPPIRQGIIGVALVALATAAWARVPDGTSSFRAINGALLLGGLLLFIVAVMLSLKGPPGTGMAAGPLAPHVDAPRPQGIPALLRRWGMPVLLGLLLVPSLWFVVTVAGPDASSLQGLRDAPFSPAGEVLLASLLLPATLVLAGVWPFGGIAGGPRLAPLAALLLVLVIMPMVGDGLEHWRSPYAAWLVLAALVAAVGRNWPQLMAGAGLFAIACGMAPAFWAGTSLTIVASLLALRRTAHAPLLRLACFVAGACGIAALRATLANEVVYSVLMLLAVLVGVLRTPLCAASPA